MKSLPVLVLLSSAVLLCSAAPALEEVTCRQDNSDAASRHAVHHINKHHHHGYKFRLNAVQGIKVDLREEDCTIELQLDLQETVCHVVNPKHFEDCELRRETDQEVMANCTVLMTVTTDGATVNRYDCNTRQVKRDLMARICPDCPMLIALNDRQGLQGVHEAVGKFHEQNTTERYYILQEVGRIKSGWMMMAGMSYYLHFVLVETHCPRQSKILPEACKPLCPDRAHHAHCRSSHIQRFGIISVDCEIYSPVNTTALGPGEQEPICRPLSPFHPGPQRPPLHGGSGGPPPHAHGHGHAGSGGPPPHAHGHGHAAPTHAGSGGPPPHTGTEGLSQERVLHLLPPPFPPFRPPAHPCERLQTNPDPAIHPICSWPHPEPLLTQRQS